MAFSFDSNILCPVSDFFVPGVWQTIGKLDPYKSGSPSFNDFVFFVAFLAAVDECVNPGPTFTVDAYECPGGSVPSFEWQMTFEWNPNVIQDLITAARDIPPWDWPKFDELDGRFLGIPGTCVMALDKFTDYTANGFLSMRGANNSGGFKIGLALGYPLIA